MPGAQDLQDPRARLDQLVREARLANEVFREQTERLARQALKACRDYLDLLAGRGRKVQPASRVRMALLALRDQPAHLAPRARKAPAARLVRKDRREIAAILARLDPRVLRVRLVLQDLQALPALKVQ